MKAKVVGAILVTMVLGACGTAPAPRAQVTPKPSASAGLTDEQWRVAWANWGVSPPPPRDVAEELKPTLPPVRNATGGKISDAEARAWVLALYRTTSIEDWLIGHLRTDILSSPSNPFADTNLTVGVYKGEVAFINREISGGALEVVGVRAPALVGAAVMEVPTRLRAEAPRPRTLSPFVVTRTLQGPSDAFARFPDGSRKDLPGLAAGRVITEVEAGEFRLDPILGPIWYRTSEFECALDSVVRTLCP